MANTRRKGGPKRAATRKDAPAAVQPPAVVERLDWTDVPERVFPGELPEWDLSTVADATKLVHELEKLQADAVRYLRATGQARWLDIAIATDMSVEGARRKFRDT